MRNFENIAMKLLKFYNLKSNLIFDKISFNGKYDVDNDIIYIHKSLTGKDFFMSILHEIDHAITCKKMGKDEYKKDYELEIERCIISDLDPYHDNYYEIQAENFATKEVKKLYCANYNRSKKIIWWLYHIKKQIKRRIKNEF